MMELYNNIRKRRIELGLSQEALAEKLGYKSKTTISKIESGKIDIPQSKIVAFAHALRMSPGDLMGIEPPPAETFANHPVAQQAKELSEHETEQLEQMSRNAIARAFMKMILPNNPELQAFIDKATIAVDGEITLPDAAQLDQMYLNKMLGMFAQAVKDAKPNGDGTFDIAFNTGTPAKK